jgi:hypothetical protein
LVTREQALATHADGRPGKIKVDIVEHGQQLSKTAVVLPDM